MMVFRVLKRLTGISSHDAMTDRRRVLRFGPIALLETPIGNSVPALFDPLTLIYNGFTMQKALFTLALVSALPAFAEQKRHLDAHEHGVGALNIAVDGNTVALAFQAPGFDIVGFEYGAKSPEDVSAVEAAVASLNSPLDLFVLPEAASCSVSEAEVELEGENAHHDEHDEHDEAHDDHDKAHDDRDESDHEDEAGHTEFHAEYTLNCGNPDALSEISFAYFKTFPNAKEIEVQIISTSGARAFEVNRDDPVLQLGR